MNKFLILMILNLHEGWDDLEDQDQGEVFPLHKGGDDLVAHKEVHSHPPEEGQSSSGLENINIKS